MSTDQQPIDDGGPAFPVLVQWTDDGIKGMQTSPSGGWHEGLSLRDYFAAKAMQSFLLHDDNPVSGRLAEMSYVIADAMLAERARRRG